MMNKKLLLSATLALAALASSNQAHAEHDLRAFLSGDGLDFIAKEAPSYLPAVIEPPTIAKSFACMDFEQRDTTIHFSVDRLDISMPRDGRIRIDMDFSGDANGTLYADDLYACFGEATCQDTLDIRTASASFEYELSVEDGKAKVVPVANEFSLAPDDFSFQLSGCGFTGSALTTAIDFMEEWLLDYLEGKVVSLAEENLGPMIEAMLGGFQYEGSAGIAHYSAALADLELIEGGLALRIDADLTDPYAPAACVQDYDVGGPQDLSGQAPAIRGADADHANLAVNLGLINKGLYTVWRRGLLCLTDEHVKALGVALDLDMVGSMLPGFPPGTKFSFEVKTTDYPKVRPIDTNDASNSSGSILDSKLTLEVKGLMVDLHGDRPDGTRNTLHVELDMDAQAAIGIDPASNSIVAQVMGANITRMVMDDERKATGDGFDVARLTQMIHDHILPSMLEKMGPMALTGPAFAFGDYAVMLREMRTTDAYMSAGIDLFKIPDNDNNAPSTSILDAPRGISNPHDALVKVSGADDEIPSELLQYQVTVDGVKRPLSFMREFKVGEAGKSATYQVSVAAVDLSGNVDPSPESLSLQVDGILPHIAIAGPRTRRADEGPIAIDWTLSDDTTAPESLKVRAEIYELEDPSDALSARLIDTQDLGAGATSTTVELEKVGGVYRVELHAVDEAGNDSKVSLLLTIDKTGGCSVGGSQGLSNGGMLLLALGLLALRRRRD